jgi:polyferredoxin
MRSGFSVDVFKDRGALAREIQGGVIENTYTLHLSNLSEQPRQYRLAVSGLPGLELRSAARLDVGAMANRTWPVQLALPPQAAQSLRGRAHAIEFEVSTGDGAEARTRREKATFYVPR